MIKDGPERRKCQRYYFEKEDRFVCILQNPDQPEQLIHATLRDLSENGMGCITNKDEIDKIKTGDTFILMDNKGNDSLEFMKDIRIKIKWAVKFGWLDHGGFGCKFLDVSPSILYRLKRFMNARLTAEAETR